MVSHPTFQNFKGNLTVAKKKPAPKKPTTFRQVLQSQAAKVKQKRTAPTRPFRTLPEDGVTYSFLSEWLNCREQGRLSYVEGFSNIGFAPPLEFGSAVHCLLEAYAKNKFRPIRPFQHIAAFEKQRLPEIPAGDRNDFRRLMRTAETVWPFYENYWRAKDGMELRGDVKVIATEMSFRLEHTVDHIPPHPDDGPGAWGERIVVPIRGRFDAVLEDSNGLWIMEDKTKSVIQPRIQQYLPFDLQTGMYCYAAEKVFKKPVQGVLYNIIRRPGQKQKQGEADRDYQLRIAKEITADPDHFFLRYHVHLQPGDNAKWVDRCLNPILYQVALWWDEIKDNPFDPWSNPKRRYHYMNPEGLYTKYGESGYFDFITSNYSNDYGLTRRLADKPKKK